MKNFISISENLFESIKHINEYNQEYWSARELMPVLEYKQWRQFSDTIERAKKACEISGNSPSEHFANDRKTSPMPNGGVKYIDDYNRKFPIVQRSSKSSKKFKKVQTN